jgi:DNA primase
MLWRAETDGKDFSTPERRAGLERTLGEIVAAISDAKIAGYYRRDFEQKVFDAFKRRPAAMSQPRREYRGRQMPRPGVFGGGETVSSAVKASVLARSGSGGARRLKEIEIAALIVAEPAIVERHGELLADLPIADRELDSLRAQLLNLAASGGRLEKQGLENHLVHLGMADLVARLRAWPMGASDPADAMSQDDDAKDAEARFLKAASDLREMAEREPERARAMERFKSEGTVESWLDAQKLLGPND